MAGSWMDAEDLVFEREEHQKTWMEFFETIRQFPQRQDSVIDQLADLRIIANRFGFYDAADFLKSVLDTN